MAPTSNGQVLIIRTERGLTIAGTRITLYKVMGKQSTSESLPVITVSNADRLLSNSEYRGRCVESLIEIILDIETYHGARRIFIL